MLTPPTISRNAVTVQTIPAMIFVRMLFKVLAPNFIVLDFNSCTIILLLLLTKFNKNFQTISKFDISFYFGGISLWIDMKFVALVFRLCYYYVRRYIVTRNS